MLQPLVADLGRDVVAIPVENRFFGGNIAVTGLLVGDDVGRALADEPLGHRYLLPDVCLSKGQFLDGSAPDDLPRPVEVLATDGAAAAGSVGVTHGHLWWRSWATQRGQVHPGQPSHRAAGGDRGGTPGGHP